VVFNSPDCIRRLTPLNPFERFEDGRPRVPDNPLHPDLHQVVEDEGRAEGRTGGQNTWDVSTWAPEIETDFLSWREGRT
jgi:hypothetical protein